MIDGAFGANQALDDRLPHRVVMQIAGRASVIGS
jgi:hypothetical protein